MSDTLAQVQTLASRGDVIISEHGYDELAADGLSAGEVLIGLPAATVIEDYPNASKGPSVPVLPKGALGRPIHAVWGIPKERTRPAVLVTAYRPDPERWSADFMERKQK